MGTLLLILGGILMFGGGIWLLVLAFQESIWWGLGSLLIPFVSLVFAIMHWSETKVPFLISIGGTVLYIVGAVLLVPSQPSVG